MKRTFVVGYPRSGTTLVQSILGGHPDIATFPETHFFEGVVLRWRPGRWTGLVRPDAFRIRTRLRDARIGWLPGPGDLARPGLGSWSRRFVGALDTAARDVGADAWVEKTPGHYGFVPEISQHVEGARFVHVVRSGLDAIASYHRAVTEDPAAWGGRKCWFDLSPMGLAQRWVDAVTTTLSYAGDDRHHVIWYDDMVRAPAGVARDAFTWIGLDASERTVQGALRERTAVAADVVLGSETWKSGNTREIGIRESTEWVERVRAGITPTMGAMIEDLDMRVSRLLVDLVAARVNRTVAEDQSSQLQ
ncbi:sulfotransferase family protein [Myceligenerans xiligouense]|uniref:Sulfotransferase family protein n=1 Tax=Myceligenerans xiligouense TaxID=253184 RepID=A0A3N4YIC5_9MICO|nr:sulfotransferase [Myceligenerans xiligouense]RPF19857.1 sulfotransferase family protein [Myceligenerans xiligouense]